MASPKIPAACPPVLADLLNAVGTKEKARNILRMGDLTLREAMQGILPQPILSRSKKGFPVPTEQWLRGPLRDYVRDTLLCRESACREYFSAEAVETLLRENERGSANRHQEIWTLLVFENWRRAFLDAPRQCAASSDQRIEVT